MRAKRGTRPQDRLTSSLLKGRIFDKIKEDDDSLSPKIQVIEGYISVCNLGIRDDILETLVHEDTLSIIPETWPSRPHGKRLTMYRHESKFPKCRL